MLKELFALSPVRCAVMSLCVALAACAAPPNDVPPGAVVVAIRQAPNNLDPRFGSDEGSQRVAQLVYASLMDIGNDLRVKPTLAERLDKIHQGLTATREGRFTGEEQLREKLGSLYGAVNGFDGRPTESQLSYQQTLGQRLAAARKDFETLMTKDAAGLEKDLKAKSLEPIRPMSQEEWAKKQERG